MFKIFKSLYTKYMGASQCLYTHTCARTLNAYLYIHARIHAHTGDTRETICFSCMDVLAYFMNSDKRAAIFDFINRCFKYVISFFQNFERIATRIFNTDMRIKSPLVKECSKFKKIYKLIIVALDLMIL